jgi:CubicO group peptidase (beta-lactamase class C family)
MERILEERIPLMERIRTITHHPSLSIGVIYGGKEIFKHNMGVMNTATGRPPNSDTLYCIGSLTKAFVAASLDILIQEGKIPSWDTTVQSIIPEFRHHAKPELYAELTLRDICSHRSGFLKFDEFIQGMDGRILLPKTHVVSICNALPVHSSLRAGFHYSNVMYDLGAAIIERVSEHKNWFDFQRERIFGPLGMDRTTAHREIHYTDDNVAKPYVALTSTKEKGREERSFFELEPMHSSADSMNGGAGAIRSSVNDLLKWCKCLLQSFRLVTSKDEIRIVPHNSEIFHRAAIMNPEVPEDGDYCLGWFLHRTPARLRLGDPILGKDSASLTIYSHQGDCPGYIGNIYLVPSREAAVVVLSNGTGWADATNYIAQDILQTLQGLQPRIDFLELARRKSEAYYHQHLSFLEDRYATPLEEKRRVSEMTMTTTPPPSPPPLEELVGAYVLPDYEKICLHIDTIAEYDNDDKTNANTTTERGKKRQRFLRATVNRQEDQVWELWHHHHDVFCRLPDTFDDCLRRGVYPPTSHASWDSSLVSFRRNAEGVVDGLSLQLSGIHVTLKKTP